jgi:inner membrane transporter RhtA
VSRIPPVVLVLAGVISIQFGAALGVTLFDDVGPGGVSLLRLGFAALLLVAIWRPDPRAYTSREPALAPVFCLVLGLMNLLFYEAIDRIPLGIAVTIEFAGPLAVAVLTSQRRLDLVWVVLAAVGILLLADPRAGQSLDSVGVLLALAAAVCWAAYILLAARAGGRFTGGRGLALAMVVAAIVPLGPGVAQGGGELLDARILVLGAVVALLASVIPYSCETEALRRMPRHVFGVLMSLEPGVGALAGFVVLSQGLATVEVLAIGLVVIASAGISRTSAIAPVGPEP